MHIGGVLHHQQQITCHRKTVGRIPPDSLGQVCHQLLNLGAVLRQGIIEHIAEIHPPRQHQDKAVGEADTVQLMDALRDAQHSLFDALDALICDLVLEQDIVVVLLQPGAPCGCRIRHIPDCPVNTAAPAPGSPPADDAPFQSRSPPARSSSVSGRFCAPASGSSQAALKHGIRQHRQTDADVAVPAAGVCIGAAGTDDLLQLTHVPLIRILHQHLVCLTRHLHPAADALLLPASENDR